MINLHREDKIIDKYIFFLKGPLSQWYKSNFIENGILFNCCEQYMMYYKALLFEDLETAKKILDAKKPSEQKGLGRLVKNFNEEKWNKSKEYIVYRGNYLKFTQNEELKQMLKATGTFILVEANKEDKIWGIGMYNDDPNILKEELWGQNLLGKALMKVRDELVKGN